MAQSLEKVDVIYHLAEKRVNVLLAALAENQKTASELSDSLIHEVRVCVKRLRALLQLYHPTANKETLKTLDRDIKNIAKAFSNKRDMVVQYHLLSQAITALSPRHQIDFDILDCYFQRLLSQEKSSPPKLVVDKAFKRILKKWRQHLPPQKRKAIKAGLDHTHQQSDQLAQHAIATGQDAAYHAARKWIKYYAYQLKLLSRKQLKKSDEGAMKQLDEMGELLGELHDQSVLENTLLHLLSTLESTSSLDSFDQLALRQAIIPILSWLQARKGQYKQRFWPKFNHFFIRGKHTA